MYQIKEENKLLYPVATLKKCLLYFLTWLWLVFKEIFALHKTKYIRINNQLGVKKGEK